MTHNIKAMVVMAQERRTNLVNALERCGIEVLVRSDTLVNSESPQCVSQVWETNEADIQLTDALYPVAQAAMRRGYYLPNRGSVHCSRHQCPHWRRCEQDFGGVVEV